MEDSILEMRELWYK